jgi:hypothetical protein
MTAPVPLLLSTVRPDFASLVLQLQLYLDSKPTWVDMQTSGTGQTLIEMMSAVGAFNQFGIEGALRETALTTAYRASSIYAITRMLGVRIHRKAPANVGVTLLRDNAGPATVLGRFTQFTVNGSNFFNRNALMFADGATRATERLYYGVPRQALSTRQLRLDPSLLNIPSLNPGDVLLVALNSGPGNGELRHVTYVGGNVGNDLFEVVASEGAFSSLNDTTRLTVMTENVYLYEGSVQTDTFTSDGSVFQQMYLAANAFTASDIDVQVVVTNNAQNTSALWGNIEGGIWLAEPASQVFFDTTTGLGETIVAFGDGEHGAIPALGSTVSVTYATTTGSAANNGLTPLSVKCPPYSWVSGQTNTVISGGADEKSASYYKHMAPLIFKARNRAVTEPDYRAVALDYPGIISASILAQRDIAPYDLRWMNVVQMCVLPISDSSDSLSAHEWADFKAYLKTKNHAVIYIKEQNPTKLVAIVEFTVALKAQYTSSAVLPKVESNVRALFARQSDTLGRRITQSDLVTAAKIEGVDYVDVELFHIDGSPNALEDLIPPDNTYFVALGSYTAHAKYSERVVY